MNKGFKITSTKKRILILIKCCPLPNLGACLPLTKSSVNNAWVRYCSDKELGVWTSFSTKGSLSRGFLCWIICSLLCSNTKWQSESSRFQVYIIMPLKVQSQKLWEDKNLDELRCFWPSPEEKPRKGLKPDWWCWLGPWGGSWVRSCACRPLMDTYCCITPSRRICRENSHLHCFRVLRFRSSCVI